MQPGRAASADGFGSLVYVGEAVLRLLRVLYPDRGCLLVLEDLHWADAETLALVEYLADNIWAERLLCLGTFRPDEGNDAAELATKLETRGSADVLRLHNLDDGSVTAMAEACLGDARLPGPVQSFLTERSEGVPFLVEELLAGLLEDRVLIERDGRWQTNGPMAAAVPATFAEGVARRLEAANSVSQRVIRAAAVLGRRFEWSLLSRMAGVGDQEVLAALRNGVELQLIGTSGDGFWFRHALTHEAVVADMLPPERAKLAGNALDAVQAAHPGLPGNWCTLGADLAEQAGDDVRAAELLLEASRRDLAVGALVSAERTLLAAKALAGQDGGRLSLGVDEALTEVFALSAQVDKAIETGQLLLARIGTSSAARSAELHLLIAQAAIAGGRYAEAAASLEVARQAPHLEMARVDACAALLAQYEDRYSDAMRFAEAALHAAEKDGPPEAACEALEVIGRARHYRDLDEADRAFSRAASIASAHGLELWYVRALSEMGVIETLRTGDLEPAMRARELALAQGAFFQTALLDLHIAAALLKQFRLDEALTAAVQCVDGARRFGLMALPEALVFEAAVHAARGDRSTMDARLAEAEEILPDDRHILGSVSGRCLAMLSMLDDDLEQAWAHLEAGAAVLLESQFGPAAPFLGLWPLIGAALGRDAAGAVARARWAALSRHGMIAGMLSYTDGILAGRRGEPDAAATAFESGDALTGPHLTWYRMYARRICGQAALADGWGDPISWLREAETYFDARGDARIAAACRRLLREAGAPVPRRRAGHADLPERLRARGITGREADVLEMVADGMTNREIAERMFLSPRTVEKHVASLLVKTGLRRRAQLTGYFAGLDG